MELFPEQDLNLQIIQDLIASLEQQHCAPEQDDTAEIRPLKKLRKDSLSLNATLEDKTLQVLWLLANKVTI